MKYVAAFIGLFSVSLSARADIFDVFRFDDGRTNWQYIANTSASVLILILLIVLAFLVNAHLRARRSNRALTEIKATLEDRVAQRTAVLEETSEQLRLREAYITSIVNSMPVMLIGINEQLQVTQWNNTAEEVTGRPFEDVAGKNLWDAYPAITLTEEQVREVLSTGETISLKRTQQNQYRFDITLYRLKEHDDVGIVILISDVTRQVQAENKLAERDKLSALGELASAMAYDIGLPINTIHQRVSRSSEKIEVSELDQVIKDYLLREVETVRQSAQQATAIAQNLLDLARSYHNDKQLADIAEIMDRSVELAAALYIDSTGLTFRDININRQYAESLPQVPCLPDELVQVFTRILRSAFYAIKASEPGDGDRPQVDITVEPFVDSIWIKVAHRGQCLSPSEQLEIFEPYFLSAAENGTYPAEHRLSYSHFIITRHHQGHMSVTSDEQNGTCFNIQLLLV